MKIKPHSATCPKCAGRGKVARYRGADLRQAREAAGLSLRQLAAQASYSASFVSDVELDRRNAPPELVAAYEGLA